MKLKVYISLPIQGKDLEKQKKYAKDIAERIAICGCEPVNPFDNFLPDDAPRVAHMKADISMLLDCNAIMMCHGWENSDGCRLEKSVAEQCGLLMLYDREKNYMPKDGDVVSCKEIIVIYAGTNENGGIMTYAALHEQRLQTVVCEKGWGYTSEYRLATEAEKQRLFDALAKQGKRWNAEKKCIEDLLRWRAEVGSDYYLIERNLTIRTQKDLRWEIDDSIHNAGNYFRTREAAEKVAG